MKHLLVYCLVFVASGCWMDDFESTAGYNEEALDQFEQGDLVDDFTSAQTGQAELQQAVKAYYADSGSYPNSLAELVPRYISEVPTKRDGSEFRYDPATGTVAN